MTADQTCPECHNQFGGKMPGHKYGSNWDWVPCRTCSASPPVVQPGEIVVGLVPRDLPVRENES